MKKKRRWFSKKTTIGETARALREAKRIDQEEMAKKLGIAESTLYAIENGTRTFTPEMQARYERELGMKKNNLDFLTALNATRKNLLDLIK